MESFGFVDDEETEGLLAVNPSIFFNKDGKFGAGVVGIGDKLGDGQLVAEVDDFFVVVEISVEVFGFFSVNVGVIDVLKGDEIGFVVGVVAKIAILGEIFGEDNGFVGNKLDGDFFGVKVAAGDGGGVGAGMEAIEAVVILFAIDGNGGVGGGDGNLKSGVASGLNDEEDDGDEDGDNGENSKELAMLLDKIGDGLSEVGERGFFHN